MSTLILIRHAPPRKNSGYFLGISDCEADLSAIDQAAMNLEQFSNARQLRIYSSPLRRAYDTAKYLFPGRTIIQTQDLQERSVGLWQGCLKAEVRDKLPELFLNSGSLLPKVTPPGGEPIELVVNRAYRFLNRILVLAPGSTTIAVTHHNIIRVLRAILDGTTLLQTFGENEDYLKPRIMNLNDQLLRDRSKLLD